MWFRGPTRYPIRCFTVVSRPSQIQRVPDGLFAARLLAVRSGSSIRSSANRRISQTRVRRSVSDHLARIGAASRTRAASNAWVKARPRARDNGLLDAAVRRARLSFNQTQSLEF